MLCIDLLYTPFPLSSTNTVQHGKWSHSRIETCIKPTRRKLEGAWKELLFTLPHDECKEIGWCATHAFWSYGMESNKSAVLCPHLMFSWNQIKLHSIQSAFNRFRISLVNYYTFKMQPNRQWPRPWITTSLPFFFLLSFVHSHFKMRCSWRSGFFLQRRDKCGSGQPM